MVALPAEILLITFRIPAIAIEGMSVVAFWTTE